jgi:hypothetical protein
MAQTGRSNVRYVDPQRRYTVVLGPSWNAPFGALPHDDRAGTHDSADGRCGSYASIGHGQAALWIRSKIFVAVCSPWSPARPRLLTGIPGGRPNSEVPFWIVLGARCSAGFRRSLCRLWVITGGASQARSVLYVRSCSNSRRKFGRLGIYKNPLNRDGAVRHWFGTGGSRAPINNCP